MKKAFLILFVIFLPLFFYFNLVFLSVEKTFFKEGFSKKENLIKEKKPSFFLPKSRLEINLKTQDLKDNELTPTKDLISFLTPTPLKTNNSSDEWGQLKKLSDHTYTIKVGLDPKMATAQEIFEALNEYRYHHQKEKLIWDNQLAEFAQQRAIYFTNIGQTDEHQGFVNYVNDINNVKKLGFWSLGENSSYGYQLEATHLIEWVFAASPEHNSNQLSSDWTHVGVGVDHTQVDIIFGGNKMN